MIAMKSRKLLTADPGAEVDRRARAYLAKHSKADYAEAMRAVCKADPALARSYLDEPRFRELRLLADFLNSAPDKNLREELLSDVLPLLSERHSPSPALALAQKLNSLNLAARCVPVLDNKRLVVARFSFSVTAPDRSERARVYALLASALQSRDFKRLRCCPTCQKFFVALDHRERFCGNAECKREARKEAAREGMRQKRESDRKAAAPRQQSPLERFLEFMSLQRKTNPSEGDLAKLRPALKRFGDGDMLKARKLLAKWEREYPSRPKAIWRALTEEQREIFSG